MIEYMNKILYEAILSKIKKEIENNYTSIEEIQQIDNKYSSKKIEKENIYKIIENFRERETTEKNKTIYVFCNGNPYIVINLAIISILNNINMYINIDDTMQGVNRFLIALISNILKNSNVKSEIKLFEKIDNIKEAIFIDRLNDFNLLKNKIEIIKRIPYQSIDIYCDEEEYQEISEQIYQYALSLNIDIDIFDEEGVEYLVKYGEGKFKLILTKNKNIIEKYK